MKRKGRLDINMIVVIILAVSMIMFISMIILKGVGSGEEQGDEMIDSLKCLPIIAQACLDGEIDDETVKNDIYEVDGVCITDRNKDTICDTI